jgi:hypothetical protein
MWSTDHIANYMFTTAPAFRLNPAYPYEEDLANTELTPVNYPKQIILELLDS